MPCVGAQVVAVAVAVLFAVGFVVLVLVAGQVRQGEPIVGSDQIDSGQRAAPRGFEQVIGPGQPACDLSARARMTQPPGTDRVAELVIPLVPARAEPTCLVAVVPDVPGLGDQLDAGQHRVLCQCSEQCAAGVESVAPCRVPAQCHGEVKAKAVHAIGLYPPAQAVHDELNHTVFTHVERIAAATGVDVLRLRIECIPARVVQSTPRQGGSRGITFGGVVVDNIQDDFDAVPMQGVHHLAELRTHAGVIVARAARSIGGVPRVRHKECQGVVTPMVGQALFKQMPLVHMQLHGQQTQCGQPQVLVVPEHGRACQASVGATLRRGNLWVQGREGLDVGLVQNRARHGGLGSRRDGSASAQFCGQVDDPCLGDAVGIVLGVGQIRCVHLMPGFERQRGQRSRQGVGPGIDQQARRIEAMSGRRVPGAVRAQAIALPGRRARNKPVPNAPRARR